MSKCIHSTGSVRTISNVYTANNNGSSRLSRGWLGGLLACLVATTSGCMAPVDDYDEYEEEERVEATSDALQQARVAGIWIGQTHMQKVDGEPALDFAADEINAGVGMGGPEEPMLKLIQGRDAILKVDVVAPSGSPKPDLEVVLEKWSPGGMKTWTGQLVKPNWLPTSSAQSIQWVRHRHENSYKIMLPGDFIVPGFKLVIKLKSNDGWAGTWTKHLEVGAPNKLPLTWFDFDYYGNHGWPVCTWCAADFAPDFWDEVEAKMPVSELWVQRVSTLDLSSVSLFPGGGHPAMILSSYYDYLNNTGSEHIPEQNLSSAMLAAIHLAGGQQNIRYFYADQRGLRIHQTGGLGGTSWRVVGRGGAEGTFFHEMGHSLNMWHWGSVSYYPYKGDMFGMTAPGTPNGAHAGPTWRFVPPGVPGADPQFGTYVSPAKSNNVYRRSPMQGGGESDRQAPFLINHYGDYEFRRGQTWVERTQIIWNDSLKSWAKWDDTTKSYSTKVKSNGVNLPWSGNKNHARVYTIMAAASMKTPAASLVYPPFDYKSGLIRLFDPTVAKDRTDAADRYCSTGGCDYSLRFRQAGVTKTYMLRASDLGSGPLDKKSHTHSAINVPAWKGPIEWVELLATPNAEVNGLGSNPTVLDRWVQ